MEQEEKLSRVKSKDEITNYAGVPKLARRDGLKIHYNRNAGGSNPLTRTRPAQDSESCGIEPYSAGRTLPCRNKLFTIGKD